MFEESILEAKNIKLFKNIGYLIFEISNEDYVRFLFLSCRLSSFYPS